MSDIENKIAQLEQQITFLKSFNTENVVDLSQSIRILEEELDKYKQYLYQNISPWERVKIARHSQRPTAVDYIRRIFSDFIEFHGDRYYADDQAIIGGIGMFGDMPVTIVGHEKGKTTKEKIYHNFGSPKPEGYRKALRLMKQAEKFGRPIITFVDTPGAYPGLDSEDRGVGEAIAQNLLAIPYLKVPIIVFVIGEGGSGGALAIGVGDKIFMLENAYYSVITPEACAAIIWKDATRGKDASELLKFTAQDLLKFKIIDGIIEEPFGGAHKDFDSVVEIIKSILEHELEDLMRIPQDMLIEYRINKLKNIGVFGEAI